MATAGRSNNALKRRVASARPGDSPGGETAGAKAARQKTAAKARQAAAQTSGADVAKKIKDFGESQIGLERTQQADIEYAEAVMGIDVYSIAKLRELAEHRNKLRLARPGVRGGEIPEATISSEEALIEREAMGILQERIALLSEQGADVRSALKAYNWAERGPLLPFSAIGIKDEFLRRANEAVNAAIQQAGERALSGGPPVSVNVTQIGTNYSDTDPERNPPELPYLGE